MSNDSFYAADDGTRFGHSSGGSPNVASSGLAGLSATLVLGGAAFAGWRVIDSETEGFRALFFAIGPAILAIVAWVTVRWLMSRSRTVTSGFEPPMDNSESGAEAPKSSEQFSPFAAGVGGMCGVAVCCCYPFMLLTEPQLLEQFAAKHDELLSGTVAALELCRDEIEGINGDNDQLTALRKQLSELQPDFVSEWGDVPESWNAEVIAFEEFAALVADAPEADIEDHSHFSANYGEYDSFVSDISNLAGYSADDYWYFSQHEADTLITRLRQLRYLFVVRMQKMHLPTLTGKEFHPGYQQGDVFCFDMEQKELAGYFAFGTTNSEEINYAYAENDEARKAASAMDALVEDIRDNTEAAFWYQLPKEIPGAKPAQTVEKLPYPEEHITTLQELHGQDHEHE